MTSPIGIAGYWLILDTSGHDDVIKWKHFPRYWPFVGGIHRSPVNSPHKGQWRGALMFSLICAWKKRLSKQLWGWWFETPSSSLWRHWNVYGGRAWLFLYHYPWEWCEQVLVWRKFHWAGVYAKFELWYLFSFLVKWKGLMAVQTNNPSCYLSLAFNSSFNTKVLLSLCEGYTLMTDGQKANNTESISMSCNIMLRTHYGTFAEFAERHLRELIGDGNRVISKNLQSRCLGMRDENVNILTQMYASEQRYTQTRRVLPQIIQTTLIKLWVNGDWESLRLFLGRKTIPPQIMFSVAHGDEIWTESFAA